MLARIELNDTKRVRYKTSKNTPMQLNAVHGETAIMSPKSVATPFPPLNSAQIGKIWQFKLENTKDQESF